MSYDNISICIFCNVIILASVSDQNFKAQILLEMKDMYANRNMGKEDGVAFIQQIFSQCHFV